MPKKKSPKTLGQVKAPRPPRNGIKIGDTVEVSDELYPDREKVVIKVEEIITDKGQRYVCGRPLHGRVDYDVLEVPIEFAKTIKPNGRKFKIEKYGKGK